MLGSIVTHQKIEAINLTMSVISLLSKKSQLKSYRLTNRHFDSAICLRKRQCHFVSGILADLSEKEKSGDEANYLWEFARTKWL